MMLALGCIQAVRCNRDTCPTGGATQNPALYGGLDVPDKSQRVLRYQQGTIRSFLDMLSAMGVSGPHEITPSLVFRRISDMHVKSFAEVYEWLRPGQLLRGDDLSETWQRDWAEAQSSTPHVDPRSSSSKTARAVPAVTR